MKVTILRRDAIPGASDGDFSNFKILLLEPGVGPAKLLATMLNHDLRVAAMKRVTTLPEAVKLLSGGGFNLLITDWSRQTDAPKLLNGLRGPKSFNRQIPVIVITRNSSDRDMRLIRNAGADEVVHRPFTVRILRSRLKSVGGAGRPYVEAPLYFGPDRRRFRREFEGEDQRRHANVSAPDRRKGEGALKGTERRQGYPGFQPVDRRATNVRAKIAELEAICTGLDFPQVLALRRITLADPKFQEPARIADLDDFFTVQLLGRIDDFSFEKLEEVAPGGFEPLLPPGSDDQRAADRDLIFRLTRHILS